MPADTALFVYGTTRATTAIVTRSVARTALLATEGFPDVFVIKEGGKRDRHDFGHDYPQPYIPVGTPSKSPSGSPRRGP